MFTTAIVKTPCQNITRGISTANLGRPDYNLALQQHAAYIQALKDCGLDVTVLDPDENFPDSTFVEDVCLITPRCAIITRPGAASRREEALGIEKTIQSLGLPVGRIQGPGTLDAGDVMMVKNHYFAGLSDRTNTEGALQLSVLLKKYEYTCSTIALDTVLHLKTGVSYLENNTLLALGEFLTLPALSRFNRLEVVLTEAYAANCVWINDTVLVPRGFPITLQAIKDVGYPTIEVDMSEFRKLDGGLSCLSLRF